MGSIFGRREHEPLTDEQRQSGELPRPNYWKQEIAKVRRHWSSHPERYRSTVQQMIGHMYQRIAQGYLEPRSGMEEVVQLLTEEYAYIETAVMMLGADQHEDPISGPLLHWNNALTVEALDQDTASETIRSWAARRANELLGLALQSEPKVATIAPDEVASDDSRELDPLPKIDEIP